MQLKDFLHYPIALQKDELGMFVVTCPSAPECITQGKTKEECIDMALDALLLLASGIGEFGWVFPPSNGKEADLVVDIPPILALKIILRNAMVKAKVKPSALAKKLGVSPQSLNQTLSMSRKSTKFDVLFQAFEALGLPLNVSC